jgi:alkylated DNA repair protein (DNA oxidative demethylase)
LSTQLTLGLLDQAADRAQESQSLGQGAVVLRGFALGDAPALLGELAAVVAASPFRNMLTPGGFRMSVAMTNCGALGWVSDRAGYRYTGEDPEHGRAWPAMPESFRRLATGAAARAGFDGFAPDACLVNQYAPGTRLALHQDKNERDFDAPIVSVSLGIPAVFLFGGLTRGERPARVPLAHGDVVVWGGAARLRYHGVLPLKVKDGDDSVVGRQRINLTFRKAG